MNEEMKAKRHALSELSQPFKLLVKEGAIETINEGLAQYYKDAGHEVIKSYRQWQKEGYQVKKGSHALLFWGEPVKNEKPAQEKTEEKKEPFYPLAYLFSNLQVEKR